MEGGSLELIEDMEDLILDTKKRLISAEDVNPFEKERKTKCLSHTVFPYIISISTAAGFLLKFF